MCDDKIVMKKHFVVFLSPGTCVAEQTSKEIEEWNVDSAVAMAKKIKERHSATPYGFYFTTYGRGIDDLDSRRLNKSNMYYLGGKILTLEDVKAQKDDSNSILISNMEINKFARVIQNTNSWKVTFPLEEDDVVLDYKVERKEADDPTPSD